MTEASLRYRQYLEDIVINEPLFPVLSEVDVCKVTLKIKNQINTENIKDLLIRQMCQPVRWGELMKYTETEYKQSDYLEIGSGLLINLLNENINIDQSKTR